MKHTELLFSLMDNAVFTKAKKIRERTNINCKLGEDWMTKRQSNFRDDTAQNLNEQARSPSPGEDYQILKKIIVRTLTKIRRSKRFQKVPFH